MLIKFIVTTIGLAIMHVLPVGEKVTSVSYCIYGIIIILLATRLCRDHIICPDENAKQEA